MSVLGRKRIFLPNYFRLHHSDSIVTLKRARNSESGKKEQRMWYVRRIVFFNALQSELLEMGYLTNTVRHLISDGMSALSFGS
jgi:hypothetical protein